MIEGEAERTADDGLGVAEEIRVLHVDDEPDLAELSATFLERHDDRLSVTTATGTDEGLARLTEESFDCIVSDYDMPDRDGLEFLRTVRARHGDLPFILFTGRGSEEVASEAVSAGVSDYLRKEQGTDQYAVLATRIRSVVSRTRAERQLQDHLDRMTDAFYALDADWRLTYLNDRAAEFLQRDREALLGEVIWNAFPRMVDSDLEDALREAMATQDPVSLEYEYSPLDAVFEVRAYPSDTGLSVYLRDVTERKARERELRETSERLRLALRGAEIGVWDWNVETDTVTFDEQWASMLGYDLDEIDPSLDAWEDRVHPDDRERVWEALEAHFAGETEYYQCDHRMRARNGEWRWIRDLGKVFDRDENGDPVRAVGIHIDVTEERPDEDSFRHVSARLEALFEHSPDMIDVHDADGRIVDVNRSMCDTLGYDREELVGKWVWEIDLDADPDDLHEMWESLEEGETERVEGEYLRKDGTTIPVEVHIRRLDLQGADRFLVSSRDISDQREYRRRLERENERLDEFTSIVSHDLRNPLSVFDGYLDLARESGDPEHFDRCEAAVEDMRALIDDLLSLARQGRTVGEIEPVSVAESAIDSWENVESDDEELVVDGDRVVDADPDRLQQLLENLFRNAVDHGGTTVTVGSLPDGFFVADDGPGIPEDQRDTVFDSGYTTSADGTGFGLAIVQRIVEAHGWAVRVTETDGGGARFEVVVDA